VLSPRAFEGDRERRQGSREPSREEVGNHWRGLRKRKSRGALRNAVSNAAIPEGTVERRRVY